MIFNTVDGVLNISVNMVTSVTVAAMLFVLGYYIRSKVKVLEKYCIPAPVVGTFLFMLLTWFGTATNTFSFAFVTTLQPVFMLAFFTTIGLGASLSLLKKGGILLVVYWLIAGGLSILQNAIAITVGPALGLYPAHALLLGAITLIGGHGAAAAYGGTFEAMGYPSAMLVGASGATFGLIVAILIGGPMARRLVEKNNLKPDESENFDTSVMQVNTDTGQKLSVLDIMKNITAILFCMGFGAMISAWVSGIIGMGFPDYVGAMFLAMIVRNLNEKVKAYKFDYPLTEKLGDITLGLFLSMALMTLRLWELADMAGPMLVVLACQVALMLAIIPIVFRILGKNYDAAVMCSGLIGHGLGATPTAIVNMSSVNDRYGMSRKAMMIVPIVGAFLVDIIYQPQTIWFISRFVVNLNP
ncbi:MAG: sodium/glutamate symporter [Spirochaetes bacterium]|nr:sodium/glutamate symporter [Spirochaetota bacterium]